MATGERSPTGGEVEGIDVPCGHSMHMEAQRKRKWNQTSSTNNAVISAQFL